jgi:hypothetical protein
MGYMMRCFVSNTLVEKENVYMQPEKKELVLVLFSQPVSLEGQEETER